MLTCAIVLPRDLTYDIVREQLQQRLWPYSQFDKIRWTEVKVVMLALQQFMASADKVRRQRPQQFQMQLRAAATGFAGSGARQEMY